MKTSSTLMMATIRVLAAAVVLSLCVGAQPSRADGEVLKIMTPADKARLDAYDATRRTALDEARAGGNKADLNVLDAVVNAPAQSFAGLDLTGDWRCRTMKAGGLSPLVVYGWFKCRVSDDGSGWRLEKLSGSQRTTGRFFDDGPTRLIYLGSFSVNEDNAEPYGSGPDSDQVGYAFRNGKQSWRIEFPSPRYESKLDILELKR